MASAIFQDMTNKFGYGDKIGIMSAGASAWTQPASKSACIVMEKRGLNLRGHVSKQLTEKQITDADLILTMTNNHKQAVLALMPAVSGKVFTLPEFAGETEYSDINDPFDFGESVYERCAEQIAHLLDKSWGKILKLIEGNAK